LEDLGHEWTVALNEKEGDGIEEEQEEEQEEDEHKRIELEE
jgi:hypothetical protein